MRERTRSPPPFRAHATERGAQTESGIGGRNATASALDEMEEAAPGSRWCGWVRAVSRLHKVPPK